MIIDEQPANPKYYEQMSKLLDDLIKARKEEAEKYEEYLARIVALARQVKNPAVAAYPKTLNTPARRALYDNLGQSEELALTLDAEIMRTKRDDWRGHPIKEKEVKNAIKGTLKTFGVEEAGELSRVFELVKQQNDY